MIVPDKNKVYGEYYQGINKINDDEKGRGAQFISYIQARSDMPAFYLRDELIEGKNKGLMYYKRDTHWSKLGAYQGYLRLKKEIEKETDIDFQEVSEWNKVTEVRADLSNMYHQDPVNDATYLMPNTLNYKCSISAKYGFPRGFARCEGNGKYRIFVLRDSMFDNLLPYMVPNFKVMEMHWKQGITAEELERIKTDFDIVLVENVERATSGVMAQVFPTEGDK